MRRSTVIYILLFLVMAGLYYYLNHHPQTADIAVTPGATISTPSFLFNAADGQPTDILVEAKDGGAVELTLNASKAWTVVKPIEAAAEPGSAEAAASGVTAISITDKLSASVNPKDVGLDTPAYKITIKFNSGVERIAQIGVVTPT